MIRCTCPNGHQLNVKASHSGKKGKCPKCGSLFRIPSLDDFTGDGEPPQPEEQPAANRHAAQPNKSSPEKPHAAADADPQKRVKHDRRPSQLSTNAEGDLSSGTESDKARSVASRYPLRMSDLTGWKAVVVAICIVSIVSWRVYNKMNRWNSEEVAGVNTPGTPAATTTTLERGDDFTIDGIASLPTPVGYQWRLEDDEPLDDGTPAVSYSASSDDVSLKMMFSSWALTVNGDANRLRLANAYRERLIPTLKGLGIQNVNGAQSEIASLVRDRVQFSLTGTHPDGTAIAIRAGMMFGNNVYHYEIYSTDGRKADLLVPLIEGMKELARARIVELSAPVFDTAIGDDGRLMVLHLSMANEAAIVDLAARKIVATIPVPQDALITAGKSQLVVVTPADNQLTLWSLDSFEIEKTGAIEIRGKPHAISMGASANGHLLIHWVEPERDLDAFGMLDLETFAVRLIYRGYQDLEQGIVQLFSNARSQTQLRAAADGRVFMLRPASGSSQMERLFAGRIPFASSESTGSGGHAIPSPDARFFYTGQGAFSAGMIDQNAAENSPCFATTDSRYYLTVNYTELQIRDAFSGATLLSIPTLTELGGRFAEDCKFGYRETASHLMPDQRIHCVPQENILVTIPKGEDRLQFRDIRFDALPDPTPTPDTGTILLPGIIYGAASCGDGRYIALHLPEINKVALADLPGRSIVGMISVPDGALISAGRDKLIVVDALEKQVARFSLSTLEQEQSVPLDLAGTPLAIVMGSASTGPALLHWSHDRRGEFSLLDVDSLQLRQLSMMASVENPTGELAVRVRGPDHRRLGNVGLEMRASADGQSFGVCDTLRREFEVISIGDVPTSRYNDGIGYAIPMADGRILTTTHIFSADLESKEESKTMFFPTADSKYVISLKEDGSGELVQFATGAVISAVPTLVDFGGDVFANGRNGQNRWQLMLDQRVYCLPKDNLLAAIPLTDDRIMIRDVEFNVPE